MCIFQKNGKKSLSWTNMMFWGRGRHRILKLEFQIPAYFTSFRSIDNFLSKCVQWSQWLLLGLSSWEGTLMLTRLTRDDCISKHSILCSRYARQCSKCSTQLTYSHHQLTRWRVGISPLCRWGSQGIERSCHLSKVTEPVSGEARCNPENSAQQSML